MAGIYIHVPYCKTRCIYCDFFTQTDISSRSEYVKTIAKEIELRKNYIGEDPIKTIYFGGGTPSQLTKPEFSFLFDVLNFNFDLRDVSEITMEANPDDLTNEYIETLQELPFNRLSIGVQSFNDTELKFLNRRHSAQKAIDVVRKCQETGFNNISIDLMYGLPKQTIDIWQQNIETALDLNIQHISSYHLIYEQGTQLFRLVDIGKVKPVSEDLSLEMFSLMIDSLGKAGFEHYEISNFAKKNLYSQHNSSYWLGDKYLGLGPSAHSYNRENRSWNVSSISQYISGMNNNEPNIEIEELDINTRYNDFILTGMRTMWGVDLDKLKSEFGDTKLNYCMSNVEKHLNNNFVERVGNILKLTRKGIFISDDIMSDMMYI